MTTNVYDLPKTTMATDSRWSYTFGRRLVYTDDSDFEKIEIVGAFAVMFAGVSSRIQQWKDFLRTSPTSMQGSPPHIGTSIAIVDCANQSVVFQVNQKRLHTCGSCFAGSGAEYAYLNWTGSGDARQAIEVAMKMDPQTGGIVKFFDTKSKKTNVNLASKMTAAEMHQSRGLKVMNIDKEGSPPFALKELAANDEELSSVASKLATGEISMSAPFEGMDKDWTDEEKAGLSVALGKVFGWK